MRGEDRTSGALFSYVDVEARIAANHPLRAMRRLTNAALAELDASFSALYEDIGRPSIPPERCCALCCCSFSIRSARSGNWSNGWSSTCCFADLSGCRSTRRCSTPRASEEPRPLAHARSRARVSVFAPRPGGGKAASEHREFFGLWNDVEGLGVEEELPSQEPALGRRPGERPGRSASARAQRRSRLPQDQRSNATHASTTDRTRAFTEKAPGRRAVSPISATP